ncbi:MAG: transcriptional regulator [archaeon]|nr:transcriptional regulator [archaeon]
MSRESLIKTTRSILSKGGFDISSLMLLRSVCFDIVGRRGDTLLIIKILYNIDAFSKENAEEMKTLAEMLDACPILIGERSSSGFLEPGIVYSRFNIQIVSNETLADLILEDSPPFIFAAPGGLYVKLDNVHLKNVREEEGISLGTLADIAGVSRRAIQMYETGMSAMIDAALRLEEFLDTSIIKAINPFEYKYENKPKYYELSGNKRSSSEIFNQLLNMGFSVTPVLRSPFEALTRSEEIIILTGLSNEDEKLIQKAMISSDISRITRKHSVIIVEKEHGLDNVESTAIVTRDELNRMSDKDELTDVVISRCKKQ